MSSVAETTQGVARTAASAGAAQLSRLFDLMVAAAVLIVLIAAFHIHMNRVITLRLYGLFRHSHKASATNHSAPAARKPAITRS